MLINTVDKRTTNEPFFVPLSEITAYQPIALGILAALTPQNWDVELVDENFENFDNTDAELIGISAYSTSINRAIDISRKMQSLGKTVVLGGKHASLFPVESQQYFNSVVAGEAEPVWEKLISDYENNSLKSLYTGQQLPLTVSVRPRRDIFNKYNYAIATIQFSRGCVYNCSFCGVPVLYNHTYRQRNVDDVLEELKEIKQDYVFFVDDNIICKEEDHKTTIRQLFQRIYETRINKYYMLASSINIVDDEKLLYWCKKAGVKVLYIGFESEKIQSLRSVNKASNFVQAGDYYKKALKKIHKYKISVMAGFICGFDNDTKTDLQDRVNYMTESTIDSFTLTYITPLAHTNLYKYYEKQNRLMYLNFPEDWIYYNACNVTVKPLDEENKVSQELFYHHSVALVCSNILLKKFFKAIFRTKSFKTAFVLLVFESKMHVYLAGHWFVKLLIKR